MLILIYSTLLKSWRLRAKSRYGIVLDIFSTSSMLFVFFLIDRFQKSLVGDQLKEALSGMDTSYFGYVALGLAVSELATSNMGGILGQFQEDKRYSTLEQHIALGVGIRRWAVAAGVVNFLRSIFRFFLIYGVAVGVLGLHLPAFRVDLALLLLLLAVPSFWALSLVSLCSVLLLRRGNVFGFLIALAFEIFSGVYVPIKVLPAWIQPFSEVLPITPALRALQLIFYKNGNFQDVQQDILKILLLTVLYLPLACLLLAYTDGQAKRKGYYVLD